MPSLGPIGFKGGLNTKASAFSLEKDQMSAAQNVRIQYNDLIKINGSAAINTSALNSGAAVIGVCDWQTLAQNRYLLIIAGTKIYRDQNLGVTPTDITGAATIAGNTNDQHTFASLNNILAICGGVTPDTPLQWTGTGNVASLAGAPPVGSLVTVANNFMFISGVAAAPSTVYWSNASDPNTWNAANNINFRVSDGDIITAIAPLGYNLAIFKRRSTGLLYTQTTSVSGAVTLAPLTQVNTYCGCAGSQCWDALPDGRLIVLGWDAHLRIFDGMTFEDISDPAPPGSNIQPSFDNVNITRIPYCVVRVYPTLKQIWVAVSTGSNTTNDSVYVYNYEQKVWECIIPDRAINVMASSIDNRAAPHHPIVLLSGNYGGFVYEQDTGSTNAQNADSHIDGYGTVSLILSDGKGRDFNPKSLKLPIEAQTSGQLQVGWGYDGFSDVSNTTIVSEAQGGALLDSTFFLDSSTLAVSATLLQQVPLSSEPNNHTIQIQFRNQFASQPFTVHPFYLSDEVLT
jgi:hypothetical protein